MRTLGPWFLFSIGCAIVLVGLIQKDHQTFFAGWTMVILGGFGPRLSWFKAGPVEGKMERIETDDITARVRETVDSNLEPEQAAKAMAEVDRVMNDHVILVAPRRHDPESQSPEEAKDEVADLLASGIVAAAIPSADEAGNDEEGTEVS